VNDKFLSNSNVRETQILVEEHFTSDLDRTSDSEDPRIAKLKNADLLTWSRHFLPHHFTLPPSRMHVWLASHLDSISIHQDPTNLLTSSPPHLLTSAGLKLNALAPRGSAKSTLTTLAFVIREALSRRHQYIWIVSDTHDQAASHLENIKLELVKNDELARVYPADAGLGPVWRSDCIVLKNGVKIEAFGTGQRIRGRRRRQFRPTLIICDDLENDSHILSGLVREKTRAWFHGTLMKAGTWRTHVINLGTALHRESLAVALGTAPGWIGKTFRAIEVWPDNMPLWARWEEMYCDPNCSRHTPCAVAAESGGLIDDDASIEADGTRSVPATLARHFYDSHRAAMDAGAVLLWPEHESLYTLMSLRAESGHTAFDREKQCLPVNPDLCEWPEEYFGDHIWFDTWPDGLVVKTIALDPSKGADARRGDYSAYVMLGMTQDKVFYLEADLARRPVEQIVADGVELYRRFKPDIVAIEKNQFQELLGNQLADALSRAGFVSASVIGLENKSNKLMRIRLLGPHLAARRLRFVTRSPGTRLLVEQLREFPLARHDDGPDAAAMALQLVQMYLTRPPKDGLGDNLLQRNRH
jgi:predicted phage terminase large subunit-like protein